MHMAAVNQRLEEFVEIGDEQVADVQPVHVGVGGEDDFLVAQVVGIVLHVQRAHEVIHLVVLIHHVSLEIPHVERLALEGEDGLGLDVAAACDRATGGLALADEDHRAVALVLLLVEVPLAVLELRHPDADRLGALAGKLLDLLEFLAQLPAVVGLSDDALRDLLVAVEEVQQLFAHLVHEVRADFRVAQLVLGLRLEHRIFQPDRHRADDAFAHVVALVIALRVFVHRLEQALAEGAQVSAAVAGVLAVDEGEEVLAVAAVAVREAELQRLAGEMERGVDRLRSVNGQLLHHQVVQPVARDESLVVEHELQARVQVGVVPQPALDELVAELRLLEDFRVRREADEGAVGLGGLALLLLLEPALLERRLEELPLPMAADHELLGQRVDRLGADAVEAHAELEHLVVVFRAGVNLADAVNDLAQRDATAEVAHGYGAVGHGDVDLAPVTHDELVNGVINDLLQQHVAAVIVVRPRAYAPDIHAGAEPDVFNAGERLDFALVVCVRFFVVGHVRAGSYRKAWPLPT